MTAPGRDDLARALTTLIDESGVVPAEIARRTGISEPTISRYRRGLVVPKPAAVEQIIAAVGNPDSEAANDARRIAEDLQQGQAHRIVVLRSSSATAQERWASVEGEAARVSTFTPLLVPGLLQTEKYMRAVFESNGAPAARVDANVAARLGRQKALAGPDHRFTILLTEGALMWRVIDGAAMVEQCRRIADVARTSTAARVGIIPWTTPITDLFPMTNFDVYDDARVVIGTGFGTAWLDRPLDVAPYVTQFTRLCDRAVWGEDCALEVDRIGEKYLIG